MGARIMMKLPVCLAFGLLAMASSASAQDDKLEKIKAAGELRVCNADYKPSNFKNPLTNEWEGVNVDIAQFIADQLKVKLVNVDANWGTIPQSIATDKCDISSASTYVTPDRAELALFTIPVQAESLTAYVPLDSKIDSWADLDQQGIVVGTFAGSFEETVAKSFFKQATVKPIVTDKISTALLDTMNGRVDAYFSSVAAPLAHIKENPQFKLRPIADKPVMPSSTAFMLPLGEYHLQQYLNAAITQVHESGKYREIRRKWLGDLVDQIPE